MKKKVLGAVFAVLAWHTAESQCGQYPVLDIGNDTMLCPGASVTYAVPAGYDSYNWNIGAGNQPSVTITSPTTLILKLETPVLRQVMLMELLRQLEGFYGTPRLMRLQRTRTAFTVTLQIAVM